MNTELFEYLKKISKKEYFAINLIDSILGVAIIILAILGLVDEISMSMYAFMFGAGAIMLFLNFYKGVKRGSRNRWFFLACAIVFSILCAMFFYAIMW